jgi:hypothetical protein
MPDIPKVSIAFSTGNLLKNVPAADGLVAFIGTGTASVAVHTVFSINSLADAIAQGFTLAAEPTAYNHLKEFYAEVGGNQQIYVLLVANTVTMAQMLDYTNANYAQKLITAGEGKIAYLGVFRNPVSGYDAGSNFMDADVSAAVLVAKTFVQNQNTNLKFLRVLIEGRVNNESSTTIFAPNTSASGQAGVVLGSTTNNKGASIGLALGRKVKYPCHIKMGKTANGPLSATAIYIGTKLLKDVANLETLHGKGYISFVTYPNKAGFFFGIDNMAANDDYRLLVNGAVVDAVAKITASVYIDEIESEVDTNADGTITDLDAKHLEDIIEQQVVNSMGDRISGIKALVDRTSNIINTGKTKVTIRVRPKGYNTFIDVDLGLTAGV